MEKTFIRIRSTKDLIISLSIAIAGAILIALPTSVSVNLVGFFMIFAGIIMLLFMKTGYKDVQTGTRYSKKESFYPQSMRADIETCLESGKGKSVLGSEEGKGNADNRGSQRDIYCCKSSGKAYVQLFEYVPYKYVPCTCVYEYDIAYVPQLTGGC